MRETQALWSVISDMTISMDRMLAHMAWANQRTFSHLQTLPEESLKAFATNPDWFVAEIVCLHLQFKRTRFCQWQVKQYVLNTTTYGTYAHSHEFLLVAGEGFEPSKAEPGDLQSPPIGRSGNPPRIVKRGEV